MSFETGDFSDFDATQEFPGLVDPVHALEELYREGHFDTLAAHVGHARYVPPQDQEDLAQDLLVHALLHPELVTPEGLHYGRTVANNLVTDQWRHGQADVTGHAQPRLSELLSVPNTQENVPGYAGALRTPDNSEKVTNGILTSDLLAGLPDTHKNILTDYYFNNMNTAQLAEKYGIPVGTVKSRLHYGKAKIRGQMNSTSDRGDDDPTPVQRRAKRLAESGYLRVLADEMGDAHGLDDQQKADLEQEMALYEMLGQDPGLGGQVRRDAMIKARQIARNVLPGLGVVDSSKLDEGRTTTTAVQAYAKGPITTADDHSERVVEEAADRQIVDELLSVLPPEQRVLARMHYGEGRTATQIAAQRGTTAYLLRKELASIKYILRKTIRERGISSLADYRNREQ